MSRLPPIVSLVPRRFEDGDFSGVPRFDWELRRALPELTSVNTRLPTRAWLRWLALRAPDTIVITGNETSLLVPERLRTIVLHHGCAQTHFERDPEWRGKVPRSFCYAQRRMYGLPNRWFIALAQWTANEFSRHHGVPLAPVLPSWVERIAKGMGSRSRPVVLGDFRTFNKGSGAVEPLRAQLPQVELRALKCTYQTRVAAYQAADAYLCLSLSEGGSFSVSDAEAAELPLVTTDVGNHLEYTASYVLPWQERDQARVVAGLVEQALATPRGPSFFETWTFDEWRAAWLRLIEQVADSRAREPLLERVGPRP